MPDGSAFVAIFALHRSMSAEQREAVLVIPKLLNSDVPALNGVALGAVGTHLALVNVTVTILAIFPDVGENRFDVALRALHFFVHATEGVFGFVVIKFRIRTNRAPTSGSVAVFARDGKGAVRTSSRPLLRRLSGRVGWLARKEQEPSQSLKKRLRNCPLKKNLPTIRLRRPGGTARQRIPA